jgi:hypothetical protein
MPDRTSRESESNEASFERVRMLVERADMLRMQSAAVPLKDLKAILQLYETVRDALEGT